MKHFYPSLVLGYHGCSQETGEAILAGKSHFFPSENDYDWLGSGVYFWEQNPSRAYEWANLHHKKPFVIGAIIDLGYCLNLLESEYLNLLSDTYKVFNDYCNVSESPLPQNKIDKRSGDELQRHLDCAVINFIHKINEAQNQPQFDSVRGVFTEGQPVYPGAGIQSKNHIQICVRNNEMIRGLFLPQ